MECIGQCGPCVVVEWSGVSALASYGYGVQDGIWAETLVGMEIAGKRMHVVGLVFDVAVGGAGKLLEIEPAALNVFLVETETKSENCCLIRMQFSACNFNVYLSCGLGSGLGGGDLPVWLGY